MQTITRTSTQQVRRRRRRRSRVNVVFYRLAIIISNLLESMHPAMRKLTEAAFVVAFYAVITVGLIGVAAFSYSIFVKGVGSFINAMNML